MNEKAYKRGAIHHLSAYSVNLADCLNSFQMESFFACSRPSAIVRGFPQRNEEEGCSHNHQMLFAILELMLRDTHKKTSDGSIIYQKWSQVNVIGFKIAI